MSNRRKNTLRICFVLTALSLPFLAWAQPRTAICLASSIVGKEISNDGSARASRSIGYPSSQLLTEYVEKGRGRVKKTLWDVNSKPEVIFLDGEKVFGILDYNQYGSSVTLPNKTCLLIGPKGANIDVVAHELVHADIAHMLGYWKYLKLPVWVNEGIAMQVDRRERYNSALLNGIDASYVSEFVGGEFYSDDTAIVVQNYTAAKYEIKKWITEFGVDNLSTMVRNRQMDKILSM